jgi:DNA-binding transcriptional ArsR family regulator
VPIELVHSNVRMYNLCASFKASGSGGMQNSMRQFQASVFQALAHPTRVAVVELLAEQSEVSVTRICDQLGIEQANASQHLAVLRARNMVVGRKDANQVFYSLRDPILGQLLALMRQYFHAHLKEALQTLKDLEGDVDALK